MRAEERIGERIGEKTFRREPDEPVPPPITDGWDIRSTLPGVIASDNVPSQAHFDANLYYGNPGRLTFYDENVKLSGGGSIRQDIPNGYYGPGSGGVGSPQASWDEYMFDWGTYCRENTQVFVQWRQRFGQVWVDNNGGKGAYDDGEFKNFLIRHGNNSAYPAGRNASCAANELVYFERHPTGGSQVGYMACYHSCLSGGFQGVCQYQLPGYGNGAQSSCQNIRNLTNILYYTQELDGYPYYGDEWMTFLARIVLGPYGQAADSIWGATRWGYTNSKIYLFIGRQNQPLTLVHRQTGAVINAQQPNNVAVYIKSIAGSQITTGSPITGFISNGGTVWIHDTLTALDGNSYTVANVTATSLELLGAPAVSQNPVTGAALGGTLWFINPGTQSKDYQRDPSLGMAAFNLYPTELNYISAPDSSIYVDEMIASREPISAPGNEPPPYVQALSPLEGKRLTSVGAGYATPYEAFQADPLYSGWLNSPPFIGYTPPGLTATEAHVANAWNSWSGGAGDSVRNRMYVHGGGHNDSAFNGLFQFDANSDDDIHPNGWRLLPNSLSASSDVIRSSTVYADGKPTSIHSYDGLYVDMKQNRFYRVFGSAYTSAGGSSPYHGYFDLNSNQWVDTPATPVITGASIASTHLYDPVRNRTLYINRSGNRYHVYNNETLTFISGRENLFVPGPGGFDGVPSWSSAFDYTRREGLSLGGNGSHYLLQFWDAQDDFLDSVIPLSDVPSALDWMCGLLFYDDYADCYWAYWPRNDGGGNQGNLGTLYKCNAEDHTWTSYTITGELPSFGNSSGSKGHFQRGVLLKDWRAIVFSPEWDQPAYMIKLPGVNQ